VGKRWCDVTVETPDGKRHTITVESASVYAAAMEFFGPLRRDGPRRQAAAKNKEVKNNS
jgi:hypothetical protein